MASLKAAMKSHQKTHRERGQISGRKHLGLLEKHKDYKLRAKDFHRKEKTITQLKKKASEKNPDEFYFGMIKSKTKEGIHKKTNQNSSYTEEQIKLMKTQDFNYVNLKRGAELKKIEKQKRNLHFLNVADNTTRQHVFFVDSKEERDNFDIAKRMNTLPELLSRSHNIPDLETLSNNNFTENLKVTKSGKNLVEKSYEELANRIKRKEDLDIASNELSLKRQLMGKGKVQKRKFKNGTVSYKWKRVRKR